MTRLVLDDNQGLYKGLCEEMLFENDLKVALFDKHGSRGQADASRQQIQSDDREDPQCAQWRHSLNDHIVG